MIYLAYSIAVWSNTPDTWTTNQDLTTSVNKYFIKSVDSIYILSETGTWTDTGLVEPLSEANYLDSGMDSLDGINSAKLNELTGDEIEILVYSDESELKSWVELTTELFSPLDKLNQTSEFEVLSWTDELSISDNSLEGTNIPIDTGKHFEFEIEELNSVNTVTLV